MIDNLGRMQFSDMADRVRRTLNAVQASVDPVTGQEVGTPLIQNQLVSNTDILNKLNHYILGFYADVMMDKPELFATEQTIDIGAFQTQYAFPLGMVQFIALFWKDPGIAMNPSPGPTMSPKPTDYLEMICVDDPHDYDDQVARYTAPTWRRLGDNFLLQEIPQQDNLAGILCRGVFLPPPLQNNLATPAPPIQTTYIQAPFARLAQELAILEAAKGLAQEKAEFQPASIEEELAMWRMRFQIAINNAQHPVSVQFTTSRFVQANYAGRRGRWVGSD